MVESSSGTGVGWNQDMADQARGVFREEYTPEQNSRRYFAQRILEELGAPVTQQNLINIIAWSVGENNGRGGRQSTFNILNTTQNRGGLYGSYNFNQLGGGAGVQNYPDLETGVRATVDTIVNGHYDKIVAALMWGDVPLAEFSPIVVATPWGTGIHETGRNYNYINNPQLVDEAMDMEVYSDFDERKARTKPTWEGYGDEVSVSGYGVASRIPKGGQGYNVNGQNYVTYKVKGGPNTSLTVWYKTNHQVKNSITRSETQWENDTVHDGWIDGGDIPWGDVDFQTVVDGYLMELGAYGTDWADDPEILAIIVGDMTDPMGDIEFDNAIRGTEFYAAFTDRQREWTGLGGDRHGELTATQQNALLDQATQLATLHNTYTGQTIDLHALDVDGNGLSWADLEAGDPELAKWAFDVASGAKTQMAAARDWLVPLAKGVPESPYMRMQTAETQAQGVHGVTVDANRQDIIDVWDRWGVEISSSMADQYAEGVWMKTMSIEDVENRAKEVSNAKWVHKPEDVDFDTWSMPYNTAYSGLLEVGAPRYDDDAFSSLLAGESAPNLYDFKKAVRQDDRWQDTQNAEDSYSKTFGTVGRLMGF